MRYPICVSSLCSFFSRHIRADDDYWKAEMQSDSLVSDFVTRDSIVYLVIQTILGRLKWWIILFMFARPLKWNIIWSIKIPNLCQKPIFVCWHIRVTTPDWFMWGAWPPPERRQQTLTLLFLILSQYGWQYISWSNYSMTCVIRYSPVHSIVLW